MTVAECLSVFSILWLLQYAKQEWNMVGEIKTTQLTLHIKKTINIYINK